MKHAKLLPKSYTQRYRGWRATEYEGNQAWFKRLADGGQHPRAMVISCCDSRVHVTSIFGAETGEFFIHRNIANLVPDYTPDGDHHGTSAAIEYAVTALGVAHIMVIGHTDCGGVKGCHAMCSGKAPELEESSSFVGRWMDILRPGYEKVSKAGGSEQEQISALERQGVVVSLENLMTFPFVSKAVEDGELSLHGLLINIRDGHMECYDGAADSFVKL
jgi:carbonic anhydrase